MPSVLIAYDAVVAVRPRSRRPVYRTRYVARCACGYETGGDYIDTMRRVRAHRAEKGCRG